MSISLCLMVRNEARNLASCLQSAYDLVDETIVIDTGSADTTKEIATSFGAKVFDFPWIDDFSAGRNECIRRATSDWIFWMDADERLDECNRKKLKTLFQSLPVISLSPRPTNFAYVMKCLSVQARDENHTAPNSPTPSPGEREKLWGTVVDHVRLFRNLPDIRWRYRVH